MGWFHADHLLMESWPSSPKHISSFPVFFHTPLTLRSSSRDLALFYPTPFPVVIPSHNPLTLQILAGCGTGSVMTLTFPVIDDVAPAKHKTLW